jgi:DNA-directed RNA polymerase subunit RPC12/RpoP
MVDKPNAAVNCSHCGAEIRFFKEPKLLEEFSLACRRCGRRKMYARVDIHTPKESNQEARR